MEIFEELHSVPQQGMSTGDLFRLMQMISGDHCRSIGYGEPVMKEKGLMWVIIRHGAQVQRWPKPGETLLVKTWPGPTRHGMCPRWVRIESGEGELLVASCAIWAVVDRSSRKMVVPGAFGIEIEPLNTGLESPRPGAPARLPAEDSASYTVTREVLDENGHMNNTRYYDLAEKVMGTAGLPLRAALVEYVTEAREGERLQLSWGHEGGRWAVTGQTGGPAFRMELDYAD